MMLETAADRRTERRGMVATQIEARGISEQRVLDAMTAVPREAFVPETVREFAYQDAPLPVAAGQTISQPYIVALMIASLDLEPGDRLLEVGSGSGYAAAVASRICREVIGIERHAELVEQSRRALASLGYDNVEIRHGDGTRGAPGDAPFDAILVSAGGPSVPPSLLRQLAIGGRLVIPVGERGWLQRLLRVTRVSEDEQETEDLGPVAFVPLVGVEAWPAEGAGAEDVGTTPSAQGPAPPPAPAREAPPRSLAEHVAREAEPLPDLATTPLDNLLDRVGDCRLVLIGEASHGTSEFYRMRARITRELIERRGFSVVAVEADWPDAARIDHWVHGHGSEQHPEQAFARFPTWMWRNVEVLEFVDWLRTHNEAAGRAAGFYGLDLYSLYGSISEVLRLLDRTDPETARIARERYGCLTPYQSDPAVYGLVALSEPYRSCEEKVVTMLRELLDRRGDPALADGRQLLDVEQNARVAANAEHYYRAMYRGGADSWNLRDRHMFETLEAVLAFHGPDSRAVVWAHNSHLGDASATAMAARGEFNLGQLVREAYGDASYLIGFGTDRGTVAAASDWDGPMEIKRVRPSHEDSYERVCADSGVPSFMLPLTETSDTDLRERLRAPRLERAIGVIYRPQSELLSHYFEARLAEQFDEWIWFDETRAVTPLEGAERAPALAEGHPFATFDV